MNLSSGGARASADADETRQGFWRGGGGGADAPGGPVAGESGSAGPF